MFGGWAPAMTQSRNEIQWTGRSTRISGCQLREILDRIDIDNAFGKIHKLRVPRVLLNYRLRSAIAFESVQFVKVLLIEQSGYPEVFAVLRCDYRLCPRAIRCYEKPYQLGRDMRLIAHHDDDGVDIRICSSNFADADLDRRRHSSLPFGVED